MVYTDGHSMPLSVSQVDPSEKRVVLWLWFACVVLVEEYGGSPHFQSELLDALLIVHGQQEGLAVLLGFYCGQDGEILREGITWVKLFGRGTELGVFGYSVRHVGSLCRPPM